MAVDFTSIGLLLFAWGGTYLVHSTCLVSGVWLWLRFHRSAGHQFRESLWKTALVGSLLTTPMQLMFGPIVPWGSFDLRLPGPKLTAGTEDKTRPSDAALRQRFPNEETDTSAPQEVNASRRTRQLWLVTELTDDVPVDQSAATSPHAVPGQTPLRPDGSDASRSGAVPATAHWNVHTVALGLLLVVGCVALVGAARCCWQSVSLGRRLADCTVLTQGRARRCLDELLRFVPRSPSVQLFSAPGDLEPAAFGILRWKIVLPDRAEYELSDDELRSLLAHELAHLVRGDATWLWLSRIVCSCFSFQPLNFVARREWRKSAEFLCDAWAVSRTGSPLALARCLTEVAGWRLRRRECAASLAATGKKSDLACRIERLVGENPLSDAWYELQSQRRPILAAGFLLVALAIGAPRVSFSFSRLPAQPMTSTGVELASATPLNEEATVTAVEPSPIEPEPHDALVILDRELGALEQELAALETALRRGKSSTPEALRLITLLAGEISRIVERRRALETRWKQTVPFSPDRT